MALLAGQRPGSPPYCEGWVADQDAFAHRWTAQGWCWSLTLLGRPLTVAELAALTASLPLQA